MSGSIASPVEDQTKSVHLGQARVAFVGQLSQLELPDHIDLPRFGSIQVDRLANTELERYLRDSNQGDHLAAVFIEAGDGVPEGAVKMRGNGSFSRTRIFVVGEAARGPVPAWAEAYDIEDIVDAQALQGFRLSDKIEAALRAYSSLLMDPLYTDYYLDTTYNKLFDWFETTRWDWKDVSLENIDKDLLSEGEIDYLTETAIIEFGTLPGAHNFLREWEGETSFSSWALMWGAEEARHSLIQARYLDKIGIKVRNKHALYKRAPYPIGDNQAGTLMMNIISEARASELYKRLAAHTQEPVIKRIWKLLSHDESRHCRAFYVFSQELCDGNKANQIAALKMGYIWLADRGDGMKHPAGHFYPHATSSDGIRRAEEGNEGAIDAADSRVISMIRRLASDDSIESTRDIKRKLRSMV